MSRQREIMERARAALEHAPQDHARIVAAARAELLAAAEAETGICLLPSWDEGRARVAQLTRDELRRDGWERGWMVSWRYEYSESYSGSAADSLHHDDRWFESEAEARAFRPPTSPVDGLRVRETWRRVSEMREGKPTRFDFRVIG